MVKFLDPTLGGGGGKKNINLDWVATMILMKASDAFMEQRFQDYIRGVRSLFLLMSGRVNRNKRVRVAIQAMDKQHQEDVDAAKKKKNLQGIQDLEVQWAEELQKNLMELIETGGEEVLYEA